MTDEFYFIKAFSSDDVQDTIKQPMVSQYNLFEVFRVNLMNKFRKKTESIL